ncbi:TOPRIM nucleotidyl transferase/hydrolase domain-containing protein [Agromyces sp. SYSU T0242]|uniref:TOPRIM nucleotidyl transferase/hydrolase domain-containing protein n=1 Tax=Agromyces litoreus TaxID=3158561 RepID=UPI003396327E
MRGDGGTRAREPRTVVLVEGESDRLALEALASRLGLEPGRAGVRVTSIDGITNLRRHLEALDGREAPPRVLGLFDAEQAHVVERMLAASGRVVDAHGGLEAAGFHACTADLEDELIRAAGTEAVETVIAAHGDLARFRSFQQQPHQRGRSLSAQLRRFAGTASGRKSWFAADVIASMPADRLPRSMVRLLEAAIADAPAVGGPTSA